MGKRHGLTGPGARVPGPDLAVLLAACGCRTVAFPVRASCWLFHKRVDSPEEEGGARILPGGFGEVRKPGVWRQVSSLLTVGGVPELRSVSHGEAGCITPTWSRLGGLAGWGPT